MEQLSLPFPEITEDVSHEVRMFKDEELVLVIASDSLVDAQVKRRSLVELLQRDPHNLTIWEDSPRPSGWYGLRQHQPEAAIVYQIIIESV